MNSATMTAETVMSALLNVSLALETISVETNVKMKLVTAMAATANLSAVLDARFP